MPASTYRSSSLLSLYPHLTRRDRDLLALLDAHQVLTTDQIHRLYFTAVRTCQIRLADLRCLGLLDRFRYARDLGGAYPWHWTLGLAGAHYQAATTGRPAPTERSHRHHLLRISAMTTLTHLVTANEFFVRLRHTARSDPDQHLDRWWSERTATARFLSIRPDGHGLWTAHGHTAGWFFECDLGTEALTRLTAKLDAYQRLTASGGPRYPVLFWLPTPAREAHLHEALRRDHQEHRHTITVATATHDTDPAARVWLPVNGRRRVHLTDLPGDHGHNTAVNPNWRDGHLDLTNQADSDC